MDGGGGMTSSIVRRLRETLAGIEVQITELQTQADHFRAVIAHYELAPSESESRTTPVKLVRNTMVEILKEEGKPLHFKRIYQRLRERGVEVAGKEPARNVGAHLSADDRFDSLGQGMWGLASWNGSRHPRSSLSANSGTQAVNDELDDLLMPSDADEEAPLDDLDDDWDLPSTSRALEPASQRSDTRIGDFRRIARVREVLTDTATTDEDVPF